MPEPLELVGPAELVTMLGVSRGRAAQITAHKDFPEPIANLTMGKIWHLADIREWAERRGRQLNDLPSRTDPPDMQTRDP